ncbi:MAG: hypothetical protein ACOY3K_05065 [Candidatus Omnitrophota bacterium]
MGNRWMDLLQRTWKEARSRKPFPLYIFYHIAKTAGTTFRVHLEKHLQPFEILPVYPPGTIRYFNVRQSHYATIDETYDPDAYLGSLTEPEKNRIRIILGHKVRYGIHRHFHREARYLTFLRDPVDRALSFHAFQKKRFEAGGMPDGEKKYFLDPGGRFLEFEEWLRVFKSHAFIVSFNLAKDFYGHRFPSPVDPRVCVELAKKVLREFFFVGITETFSQWAPYLYGFFGIRETPEPKAVNLDPSYLNARSDLRRRFAAEFSYDRELYEYAKALCAGHLKKHSVPSSFW